MLLAITVPGRTFRSIVAKTSRLTSIFSTIASTTMSTRSKPSYPVLAERHSRRS